MTQLSEQSLQALKALDTPTVCNAIEAVYPNRRNRGFTVRPFFCSRPKLPSVVGYARTARLRAMHKPSEAWDRDSYYSYIAEGAGTKCRGDPGFGRNSGLRFILGRGEQ